MNTEKKFFGHPRGLMTLFFTEYWERFSFYGLRGILLFYLTTKVVDGGLGFADSSGQYVVAAYMSLVYAMSLPGGFIADRFLGQRKSVLYGGMIIASGHLVMAIPTEIMLFAGLGLIVLGTGLLKPNVTVMVGGLYEKDDPKRDGGFTIFYMGINLGAMIAPLIIGWVAQSDGFKEILTSIGLNSAYSWHFAFSIAAFGMVVGLLQYNAGAKYLGDIGLLPSQKQKGSDKAKMEPFTAEDKKRLIVIGILFFFCILFWSAFEQAPTSLSLFARDFTDSTFLGFEFPTSWFQSMNAMFIIIFGPVFAWMWLKLARKKKEPTGAAKFMLGLIGAGLGYLVLYIAVTSFPGERVSPTWLTTVYLFHTLGELSLSPVGLSLMTKLAPKQIVSFVMGIWFTATSLGNLLGGVLAGFIYDANDINSLNLLFGGVALYCFIAALVLGVLVKPIKKLSGGH
jgi:proton-dependent oligopeptide transporter, POT family